jgi:autotransporter-associated beta strand protein
MRCFERFFLGRFLTKCGLGLVGLSFILIGSVTINAQTPSIIWTDSTGDNNWFNPGNWVVPSGSPAPIPTSSDTAVVNNGTTAQIGAPNAQAASLFIGETLAGSPAVAGSTVQLLPAGSLGNSTTGSLNITIGPDGTLRLSGGGISNVSSLQNNGTILFDGAINHFINTPITGSGNFIMAGGTLAINATLGTSPNLIVTAGIATFNFAAAMTSGTISVNGGTVQVAAGGEAVASLSIGTTASNSTLQLLPGGSLTVTNPVLIGPGGTLRFSGGGSSGGNLFANVIQDNGNILFDGPLSHSLPATVTGSGSVTMAGTGTLVLSGNLTYSGGTIISAGTVQAGSATGLSPNSAFTVNATLDLNGFSSTIGSLSGTGTVLNNGTMAATLTAGNDNTNSTFSGVIEDGTSPLQLTKSGTGVLTLTGANTYSGGTTISSGVLRLGNGGTTGSIVGNVTDNGLLAFDRSDSVTFAGVISGTGDVVQIGTGTVTLPRTNTYTGTTLVNAGSLIVDGSIASAQTVVNSGGFLGGHGTIGGNLVNNGTVGQINAPGTLTVLGNYTQGASGTLRIGIGGVATGQHDVLASNGHVTLGGTLQLVSLGGFTLQPGQQVTFVTAKNGVSGSFANLQNGFVTTGTIVQAQVTTLADSVVLETSQGSFATTPGVATTSNQLAVAKALDSAAGDPREAALFAFLNSQPLANLPNDLNLISPQQLGSFQATGTAQGNTQIASLSGRMSAIQAGSTGFSSAGFAINGATASFGEGFAGVSGAEGKSGPAVFAPTPENRWGVFVTGIGEFTNVGNTPNATGYDVNTGGFTLGVDYRFTSFLAVGLTAGYANSNVNLNAGGNIDVNSGKIGVYATAFSQGFYLDTAISGGPSGYNSHRTALQGTASGSTNGGDFDFLVAAGYDWKYGGLTIGPIASFQLGYVGIDAFSESGSLAALKFPDQNFESERTGFGGRVSYDWKIGHVTVIPEFRATWVHEYGDTAFSIVAGFASGAGNSFTVTSAETGRDSLAIGAGVSVIWNDRVSTYVYYDGEVARTNYQYNAVTGGVRITF